MPHAKPHPLSGYHVVPDARTGEKIYVVDWLDRLDGVAWLLRPTSRTGRAYRAKLEALGLHDSGTVVARQGDRLALVHHAELPAYDPIPVGVIS